VVLMDQWSVLQAFARWLPPAAITYADDEVIRTMGTTPLPYRTYDPAGQLGPAGLYKGSILMAHEVPTMFGYHGMESRFYDEVMGGKGVWANQLSPSLQDLWAIRYVTLNQPVDSLPGYHLIKGPVSFPNLMGRNSAAGFLWERDTPAPWVRVVAGAVLAPDADIAPTVASPAYPTDRVALYPDSSSVPGATGTPSIPPPSPLHVTLSHWEPGAMTIDITGTAPTTSYLLVAENWYPDWKATIDGQPAATYRANGAMLSVALPSGAEQVTLRFDMDSYHTGRLLMLLSLVTALGVIALGARQSRRRGADG
jgi:hypothetical protein